MESAGRFRRRYVDSIMMKVRTVAGSPPYGNSIMGWAGSKLSCEKYSTCYSTVHSLATVARPLSAVCMYVCMYSIHMVHGLRTDLQYSTTARTRTCISLVLYVPVVVSSEFCHR